MAHGRSFRGRFPSDCRQAFVPGVVANQAKDQGIMLKFAKSKPKGLGQYKTMSLKLC